MREDTIRTPQSLSASPGGPGAAPRGDLTPELIGADWWGDEVVTRAGIPVVDIPFVSVGGGIGSFVAVDNLRIRGVPTSAIRVLTSLDHPWESYEYLTRVSQVPRTERLSSGSSSCPDNIWGFPGYALREAVADRTVAPLWNVFAEPFLGRAYYTPRSGQVLTALEREYHRIDYPSVVVTGQVRMVRRRLGGGYFTILTPPEGTSPTRRVAFRSRFVHLAVGHPGLTFPPDLVEYRQRTRDHGGVVHAYEPHEQVYQRLHAVPGTVLVRGGGDPASRVLRRLVDDRDSRGLQTRILHVTAHDDDRRGPNPFLRRPAWPEQLRQGRIEGWYQSFPGGIAAMAPGPGGGVNVSLTTPTGPQDVGVTAVVDCTDPETDVREHRVLADLLDHSGAGRNALGHLAVERTFEVSGSRSQPGRLYAGGSATLGGHQPGVDSFLGLQIAAQAMADDLHEQGFVARLGPVRSTREWINWLRGTPI